MQDNKYKKKEDADLENLAQITEEWKKIHESQEKLIHSVDQRGVIGCRGGLVAMATNPNKWALTRGPSITARSSRGILGYMQ